MKMCLILDTFDVVGTPESLVDVPPSSFVVVPESESVVAVVPPPSLVALVLPPSVPEPVPAVESALLASEPPQAANEAMANVRGNTTKRMGGGLVGAGTPSKDLWISTPSRPDQAAPSIKSAGSLGSLANALLRSATPPRR
ncbi:MAG: hypothetical protein U0235_10610 [Polyangiaceae bacterium]